MGNLILEDKARIAIDGLMKAQPLIMSAISELLQQGYATEATNLSTVLTDLITRTNEAKLAVS